MPIFRNPYIVIHKKINKTYNKAGGNDNPQSVILLPALSVLCKNTMKEPAAFYKDMDDCICVVVLYIKQEKKDVKEHELHIYGGMC